MQIQPRLPGFHTFMAPSSGSMCFTHESFVRHSKQRFRLLAHAESNVGLFTGKSLNWEVTLPWVSTYSFRPVQQLLYRLQIFDSRLQGRAVQ
jgi:hypothetical protein